MATLPNLEPYRALGVNPKTGLPWAAQDPRTNPTPEDMSIFLRVIDETDAVNRYVWYNLPEGINGNLIERILYYKGQGALIKLGEKFAFLPFSPKNQPDMYGRATSLTPLPFTGAFDTKEKEKPLIPGLEYKCVYDLPDMDNYIIDGEIDYDKIERELKTSAFILRDYTQQLSQTVIPRQRLNDPLVRMMSTCPALMQTALFNSTGVLGLRVQDEDQYTAAEAANLAVNAAALKGKRYVPIVGNLEFQELAGGATVKSEEFLLAMQALDNLRLSGYGLDHGGLFQKKAHMLEAEQKTNQGNAGIVLQDGLERRREWARLINAYFGFGCWVDISEVVRNQDTNMDGVIDTDRTQDVEQVEEVVEDVE